MTLGVPIYFTVKIEVASLGFTDSLIDFHTSLRRKKIVLIFLKEIKNCSGGVM